MDTNVQCDVVDNFSNHCTGDRPFRTNFATLVLDISICVEASYDRVPWNNTRDKQTITEQLWMRINANLDAFDHYDVYGAALPEAENFTMHCNVT